jgi:hypothetical protein
MLGGMNPQVNETMESRYLHEDSYRKIATVLTDRVLSAIAWFQQLLSAPTTGQ